MDAPVKKWRIGIYGSYGGMNLGDEAILEGILKQLRASLPVDVTVFSRNPSDTLARHAVERAVNVRAMTRREVLPEMQYLDLLILGGGGILYDQDAEAYMREVFLAHELAIPVVVYAVSAGPLRTPHARQVVREALNGCAIITVRDRQGYRLLEDVGVTREIHLTADPALLLEPQPLPNEALRFEGSDLEHHLVGFSVREPGPAAPHIEPDEYHALLANAADYVVERFDADAVFIPMEKCDVQHSHAVMAAMRNADRAELVRRTYSPRQIMDLVGRLDFAVGMRLHFLIFAALRRTPFAALPYASKVSGLLDDLNMETPALGEVGIGQLIARIDRSWDTKDEIRARIEAQLPTLVERARKTNEMLVRFMGDNVKRTMPA